MTSLRSRLLVAPLVLAVGCVQVYDEGLLDRQIVTTRFDGGPGNDAPFDAGIDASDGCDEKRPPPRPAPETDNEMRNARTWGLLDITLDPALVAPNFADYGYDLDGQCTDSTENRSCAGGTVVADGEFGEDNVFAQHLMVGIQDTLGTDVQSRARLSLRQGNKVPMIHLENWNGEPNDPLVSVWAAVSADFETFTPQEEPLWDGTDIFYPREESFVEGMIGDPLGIDDAAYVADGVLVANIPETTFSFAFFQGIEEIGIQIRDLTITAEIQEDGSLTNVILAGRWRILDMLQAFAQAGFCQGSLDYMAIAFVGEQFADVRADSRSDNMGATCDAISMGVGFTGVAIELGSETRDPGEPPPNPCEGT